MKTSSYVISAAEGSGFYRHIRISSDATLLDLHEAIAAAYKLENVNQPSFRLQRQAKGKPPVKYSTNNTKTTTAFGDVKLKDTGFATKSMLIYTLSEPRITLKCHTLRALDEPTPEPQVVRASGSSYDFRAALSLLVRTLTDKGIQLNNLGAMVEIADLPTETLNTLLDYFLSASNLYGLVPLQEVYHLYNRNRQPVSLPTFTMFGIVLSHRDKSRFYVLDEQGMILDKDNYISRHAQYIAEYTVVEGDAFAYVRSMQEGKPYYLPSEDEFLRYTDEDYVEENEYYQRLRLHLLSLHMSPGQAENCMQEFVNSIKFSDNDPQVIFDTLENHHIRLKNLKAVNYMINLHSQLNNNTRTHINCGHTPEEISALMGNKPGSKATGSLMPFISPDPLYQDIARQEKNDDLTNRDVLPSPLPRQVARKPGRNEPCPCGSGKKYKHCCGKPGTI